MPTKSDTNFKLVRETENVLKTWYKAFFSYVVQWIISDGGSGIGINSSIKEEKI